MSEPKHELKLNKKGQIIQTIWSPKKQAYVRNDVSNNFLHLLDKTTGIDPNFTLNHLIKLISPHADILTILLPNCWVKEFVEHWKKIPQLTLQTENKYDPDGIEYLSLTWHVFLTKSGYLAGTELPDLDGKGWALKEDQYRDYFSDTEPMYKKGQRINWGLDFMPLEKMLHLPIRATESFQLFNKKDNTKTACKKSFTLRNIIEGIFWEISFYGPPENSQQQKAILDERITDLDKAIESGDDKKMMRVGSEEWEQFKQELTEKHSKKKKTKVKK